MDAEGGGVMDYWVECIKEAFEDAGIVATDTQVDMVASWVSGAHEHFGMAHGVEHIPNPLQAEVDKLEGEIKIADEWVKCDPCWGTGHVFVETGGTKTKMQCGRCDGSGSHHRGL